MRDYETKVCGFPTFEPDQLVYIDKPSLALHPPTMPRDWPHLVRTSYYRRYWDRLPFLVFNKIHKPLMSTVSLTHGVDRPCKDRDQQRTIYKLLSMLSSQRIISIRKCYKHAKYTNSIHGIGRRPNRLPQKPQRYFSLLSFLKLVLNRA